MYVLAVHPSDARLCCKGDRALEFEAWVAPRPRSSCQLSACDCCHTPGRLAVEMVCVPCAMRLYVTLRVACMFGLEQVLCFCWFFVACPTTFG
jgi:hypothetical protein